MLTPIWQLLHTRQPKTLLKLIGLGLFTLQSGEQVHVRLGDDPEKMMRHAAHKRVGRRVRQVRWE